MDDREFLKAADECLGKVAKWLEGFDPDEADYSAADGAVTIEFPDGGKFILSRLSLTRLLIRPQTVTQYTRILGAP